MQASNEQLGRTGKRLDARTRVQIREKSDIMINVKHFEIMKHAYKK